MNILSLFWCKVVKFCDQNTYLKCAYLRQMHVFGQIRYLYSPVYHRYSLKSFNYANQLRHIGVKNILSTFVARFYRDSSCLTIDNIQPELCPNSAPLYNPMSVVDNSAPLFFHSSHFNCDDNKFNPLSRVLKENINKICKMQHFTTLGNAAYKFFKTFRANPAWAVCRL